MEEAPTYTAFGGNALIASGELATVLPQLKRWVERAGGEVPLLFDDGTGKQVDFDLRGTIADVLARAVPARGPGRPKLGVVAREISLLPRHWEWLEQQPNGASAALRRLVDEARKQEPDRQRARRAKDAAGRVMSAIAGNLPGYEEAGRSLYAGDAERFHELIARWPNDIRGYITRLAQPAFVTVPARS
jgi:uncharacterized protein